MTRRFSFTLSWPPLFVSRTPLRDLLQQARRVERAEIAGRVDAGSVADTLALTTQLQNALDHTALLEAQVEQLVSDNARLRRQMLAQRDAEITRAAVAAGQVA